MKVLNDEGKRKNWSENSKTKPLLLNVSILNRRISYVLKCTDNSMAFDLHKMKNVRYCERSILKRSNNH